MSIMENKTLVRRYLQAISGKEKTQELVDQFVADSDQALKQHIATAEVAFPRYEMVVEDIIAEEDKVAVRFILHGIHKSDFMGIPATGKEINVPGLIIYRLADQKIVEHWMQFDSMAMMQQLT